MGEKLFLMLQYKLDGVISVKLVYAYMNWAYAVTENNGWPMRLNYLLHLTFRIMTPFCKEILTYWPHQSSVIIVNPTRCPCTYPGPS